MTIIERFIYLEHFRKAVRYVSSRNGLYKGPVQERGNRCDVGAQLILAVGEVHARLCPDAGIDVRQKRGGNPNVRRAPSVERRCEARDVQANPASDGDDGLGAAVDTKPLDFLQDLQDHLHALVLLRSGQGEDLVQDVFGLKVVCDLGAIEIVHDLIHHYEAFDGFGAGPYGLELLGVSDVAEKQSVVAGVQEVFGLSHCICEGDGADHCPGGAVGGAAFVTATYNV